MASCPVSLLSPISHKSLHYDVLATTRRRLAMKFSAHGKPARKGPPRGPFLAGGGVRGRPAAPSSYRRTSFGLALVKRTNERVGAREQPGRVGVPDPDVHGDQERMPEGE